MNTAEHTDLQAQLAALQARVARAEARGEVENLFSNYMHLHNGYADEQIIDLWVKPGTPGMRAQYSNKGLYTNWDSITAYHRGRPQPVGKLLLHYSTTPSIQVAADGQSARGIWIVGGVESGLTDPAQAANAPVAIRPCRFQRRRAASMAVMERPDRNAARSSARSAADAWRSEGSRAQARRRMSLRAEKSRASGHDGRSGGRQGNWLVG